MARTTAKAQKISPAADAKRQIIADEQWQMVQEEDKQNLQLLELSNQILALTREVRELVASVQKKAD